MFFEAEDSHDEHAAADLVLVKQKKVWRDWRRLGGGGGRCGFVFVVSSLERLVLRLHKVSRFLFEPHGDLSPFESIFYSPWRAFPRRLLTLPASTYTPDVSPA